MKRIIIFCLFILLSAHYNFSLSQTIDLSRTSWIHGAEDCAENDEPAIQVVHYNTNTWILRQNKCTNYEAPFMFLFIGEERAILFDTGATENPSIFPIAETVYKIIRDYEKQKSLDIDLIVAHTHSHGDHHAGDGQFKGNDKTTVIGLEVKEVKQFFDINKWPEESINFDLGNRVLNIIPIPGHEASSIAVYDASTQWLLTGDTFYPGRLYVNDWKAFVKSISRLSRFAEQHEISAILGNHIEMSNEEGVDYPMGTKFQPDEPPLPLTIEDLNRLNDTLSTLGNNPKKVNLGSYIIFPI